MSTLEIFFLLLLGIQVLHSVEELTTGFHKKCPFGRFKFSSFLTFEILFLSFWVLVFFLNSFSLREPFLYFFNLLMFANGIWHITWFGIEKKYVPGILTAPLFVIVFVIFYFFVLL